MGSYGTNGNLDEILLESNLRMIQGFQSLEKKEGTIFPITVTVDGYKFAISSTGTVGKTLPTVRISNLKVATVEDKETEITTTSTNKPQSGTPLELSFDVSISEGTITGADKGTLTNGKVTYDTDGTEIEIKFTFTLQGVDSNTNNTTTIDLSSYYKIAKKGEPNLTGIANMTYVSWTANSSETEYTINDTQTTEPEDWYDYDNGKWANIKTTNNGLEAYWVWIPRFEYIVPTSETATQIDVKLITKEKTTPDNGYTIHPAFTFNGNPIDGIWVAKFEASSSSPTTSYGGGDNSNLQVQVKPGVQSWRNISTTTIFSVCRKIQQTGVLRGSTNIDSHMMKNTEWGAVAILSQSKYGIFNPQSTNNGQIWNNSYGYASGEKILTGYAGNEADASTSNSSTISQIESTVSEYNKLNGPKASTTGTVYGVYDMAGGSWELVAGCISGLETTKFGSNLTTTDISKYINSYNNTENSYSNYAGAITGDATKETKGWNSDFASFITTAYPVFRRGVDYGWGVNSGIFAFEIDNGSGGYTMSFRPVFIKQ